MYLVLEFICVFPTIEIKEIKNQVYKYVRTAVYPQPLITDIVPADNVSPCEGNAIGRMEALNVKGVLS